MSLIPSQVTRRDRGLLTVFSIDDLRSVKVDMHDDWHRQRFITKSQAFEKLPTQSAPQGILLLQTDHGGGLPLEEVLEIEDYFGVEHQAFQKQFRRLFDEAAEKGSADALRLSIEKVEAHVEALDALYEKKRIRFATPPNSKATGVLALAPRAFGPDAQAMLADALSRLPQSDHMKYLPDVTHLPAEVRNSPFFVPWLIRRRGG